jgi:hypothetical protein
MKRLILLLVALIFSENIKGCGCPSENARLKFLYPHEIELWPDDSKEMIMLSHMKNLDPDLYFKKIFAQCFYTEDIDWEYERVNYYLLEVRNLLKDLKPIEKRKAIYIKCFNKVVDQCLNMNVTFKERYTSNGPDVNSPAFLDLLAQDDPENMGRYLSSIPMEQFQDAMSTRPPLRRVKVLQDMIKRPKESKAGAVRKCVAIDSPSMESVCACSKHKMLHSSYKK